MSCHWRSHWRWSHCERTTCGASCEVSARGTGTNTLACAPHPDSVPSHTALHSSPVPATQHSNAQRTHLLLKYMYPAVATAATATTATRATAMRSVRTRCDTRSDPRTRGGDAGRLARAGDRCARPAPAPVAAPVCGAAAGDANARTGRAGTSPMFGATCAIRDAGWCTRELRHRPPTSAPVGARHNFAQQCAEPWRALAYAMRPGRRFVAWRHDLRVRAGGSFTTARCGSRPFAADGCAAVHP